MGRKHAHTIHLYNILFELSHKLRNEGSRGNLFKKNLNILRIISNHCGFSSTCAHSKNCATANEGTNHQHQMSSIFASYVTFLSFAYPFLNCQVLQPLCGINIVSNHQYIFIHILHQTARIIVRHINAPIYSICRCNCYYRCNKCCTLYCCVVM